MKKIFLIACASFTVCSCFCQINKEYHYSLNRDSEIMPARFSTVAVSVIDNSSMPVSEENKNTDETPKLSKKQQVNLFIIAKRHKGKLDLSTRYNILRTKLKGLFNKDKFVSIVVSDAEKAGSKIEYCLNKRNARIGTVWFDSHGKYDRGHSLFLIGKDEISYKTLKDTAVVSSLKRIAAFADDETKLVIGSCYGGATYFRSSINYKDTTRMNGDSLMFELGKIFTLSTIYGSESWVMSKPGLFLERGSVAGYPGRNLFHDICYRPVWENIGKWNEYNAASKTFRSVNPVTLDKDGNLKLRNWAYTGHSDVNEDIIKNLKRLEPGLYK